MLLMFDLSVKKYLKTLDKKIVLCKIFFERVSTLLIRVLIVKLNHIGR